MTESRIDPVGFYDQARLLCTAVQKMIHLKGGYGFAAEPDILEKRIVQFNQRMRVDGLSKFGSRTVFSAVKFYAGVDELDRDAPLGVMIIFIEIDQLSRLFWSFDYPRLDEEDDAAILDGCGTLANLIAGCFVKEIRDAGYVHLQMSHFENHINTAINGINFMPNQETKYEIRFKFQGNRRITAELSMGHIPRAV